MDKKMRLLLTLGILFLIVVSFYIISYTITKTTGYSITGKLVYSKDEKVQIGKCIGGKDIVLYCTPLSLNCLRQKRTLGEAFEHINYVDCSENVEECRDLSMPVWKIRGRFYYGIYDLNRLVEFSGCKVR